MSESRSGLFVADSVPAAYDRHLRPQVFVPWARELLSRMPPGATRAIDVACGPGTVAHLLAQRLGAGGSVVATDASPAMLAVAASHPPAPGSAPIAYRECPAEALDAADAGVDVATCQQGIQFFPDRAAAARELRRVLAPGGAALVAVWAAERPLGLFGAIGETLRDHGLDEPYPRAFDPASYALAADELEGLLAGAGLRDVRVDTVELECRWPTADAAVATIAGTPFGPLVATLPPGERDAIAAALLERLGASGAGPVAVATTSHIAVATA